MVWAKFLDVLRSRGYSFDLVAGATNRRSVIQSAGFEDPLEIALLETEWEKQIQLEANNNHISASANSLSESSRALVPHQPNHPATGAELTPSSFISNQNRNQLLTLLRSLPLPLQEALVAEECLAALRRVPSALVAFEPAIVSLVLIRHRRPR